MSEQIYSFTKFENKLDEKYMPAKDAIGSLDIKFPVNVFTEFGELKAVIIGYVDETARLSDDIFSDDPDIKLKFGPYPDFIIKESQQIQNKLANELINRGIEVIRVGKYDFGKIFNIDGYETKGFHSFSPRDLPLLYHNSIYECPSFQISRHQEEIKVFNWIFEKLRENGSSWFKSWTGLSEIYANQLIAEGKTPTKYDKDIPLWDAANILRLGLDILFLVSESGNEQAYKFFRQYMEKTYNNKVRVHPIRNVYKGVHIDTTFTIIGYNEKVKKFIVVADSELCNPTNIPAIFRGKNWTILKTHKIIDFGAIKEYELASSRLPANFFVINSKLLVVDEKQKYLIDSFNCYGIECIPMPNPYGRELDGGFHCMTNDYNRVDDFGFEKILSTQDTQSISKEQLAGYFDVELLEFLSSKGDIEDWVDIANKNSIFPSFLTDHLSNEEIEIMNASHKNAINSLN